MPFMDHHPRAATLTVERVGETVCPACRHGWDAHGILDVCAADECGCPAREDDRP